MAGIPVICDRCGAEGLAGEGDFAGLGDLLDFEPVLLQVERVDGWNPECQRAFIAALSVLGSSDRAAKAIGKSATGAERLRGLPGAEGFCRAWEKAKAISQERGTLRLAASLRAVTRPPPAAPPAAPPAPAPEEDEVADEKATRAFVVMILGKYLIKLRQEREARIEGRIAEADFYLRQITWLEVALDLTSGDGMKILCDFRRLEFPLSAIAETPMSRLLDAARRDHWLAAGDPPRPEHPLRRLLVAHDGFSTEPLEATWGGRELSHEQQRRQFEEQHARDAAAQVEWEARARLFWERSAHGPGAREAAARPPRPAPEDEEGGP